MPGSESLLPLTIACHRLGLSYQRAWHLCLTGKLGAERHGHRWFVHEGDVEQLKRQLAKPTRAVSSRIAAGR